MPELPEVETLRRELNQAVKGKTIADVFCNSPKQLNPPLDKFKKIIKGKKIQAIKRQAKVLIFELGEDLFMIIHLKMTGQLIYKLPATSHKLKAIYGGHPQPGGLENLPNKFTHIYFTFTDGSTLYFNDMRKFGWARLINRTQLNDFRQGYGLEPLTKEFTLEAFNEILKRRPNKKIKQVLMDQELISGIGNIYADESLFCAGVLPIRITKKLKAEEIKKLYNCLDKILKLAISKGGTSADTYVQLSGEPGGFVPYLKVYGRAGEKCPRCSGTVERIKLAGRGTHFCKSCQK